LNPTVSVIVRTVRRPQRLRECLQALAAQTYREFELVLVDMSEESMTSIVEEMGTRLPAVCHLRLNGVYPRPVALNRGIESASGRLITILDDDNLWEPAHLGNIVENFNGADYLHWRSHPNADPYRSTHRGANPLSSFRLRPIAEANFIFTVATAFRRTLWDDVG
jgi:glycosyltransferase involved in cell wall biosynthesis